MPSLEVTLSKKLTEVQKKTLADELTANVTLITGKEQFMVMTMIRDDVYMQMGDKVLENGAFVNLNCFGQANPEENKAYAVRICQILGEQLGIAGKDIYMNLTERSWWATNGTVQSV